MSRYSNPSAGQGVNRFRVWPSGSDQFEHDKLGDNWDFLDGLIGIPSVGNWPPTTGVDGGIYKEVKLLQNERTPIGAFAWFFRPVATIPIPTGWAVADGSTVTAANHNFPGVATDVVLPNLINRFALGADPAKAVGLAAAAVGSGSENANSGAPGVGATGGENSHVLSAGEGANVVNASYANAMIGTDQSWPYVGPVFDGFVHGISQSSSAGAHENRPRWVGLIPIIKVKFITTP